MALWISTALAGVATGAWVRLSGAAVLPICFHWATALAVGTVVLPVPTDHTTALTGAPVKAMEASVMVWPAGLLTDSWVGVPSTALVEISQARQPCWKLGHRFSDPRVTAEVVKTGHCGWYYRVIEQGSACAADTLELIARPHPDWSVGRAFDLLVAGGHKRDPGATRALADLGPLSAEWRRRAAALG